jgi:uncharacterized protein YbdZ (MbtH family)
MSIGLVQRGRRATVAVAVLAAAVPITLAVTQGEARAATRTICRYATVPAGWVITAYLNHSSCPPLSGVPNAKTIATLYDGIVACDGSTIPTGWVITRYHATRYGCGPDFGGFNAQTLRMLYDGIVACVGSTVPPGWDITKYHSNRSGCGLDWGGYNAFTVRSSTPPTTSTTTSPTTSTTTTSTTMPPAPATMSASPSTVFLPPDTRGSTVVSWYAPGTNVDVYVTMDGDQQVLVVRGGGSGSVTVDWIVAPHEYVFNLYPAGFSDPAHRLATTTVRGVLA